MKEKKKNSYGIETEYKGTRFRSNFEADFAKYLDTLGLRWEYETMSLPYIPRIAMYVPDFKVWKPGGSENDWFLVETKGYFDDKARQKMLQIKRQYPNYDVKMFFQKPSLKIGKSKKLTYETWSEKHNYDILTKEYLQSLNITQPKEKKQPKRKKHETGLQNMGT